MKTFARLVTLGTLLSFSMTGCGREPSSYKDNADGSSTDKSSSSSLPAGGTQQSSTDGVNPDGTPKNVSDNGARGTDTTTNGAFGPGDKPGTSDGKPNPTQVLVEDGGTLAIPGVKVAKVGVNFEDLTNGDFDYNDSVLCFSGAFKVDGTNIVSYKQQEVDATVSSISGCEHDITVDIISKAGVKQTFKYHDAGTKAVKLKFDIESKLMVTMTTTKGSCDRVPRPMTNPLFAKVELNVCRTTGN